MNAMGPMQSKCRPKGVTLALHWTHGVHISMNLRKNAIHFLYKIYMFYNRSTYYFLSFYVNLLTTWQKNVTNQHIQP